MFSAFGNFKLWHKIKSTAKVLRQQPNERRTCIGWQKNASECQSNVAPQEFRSFFSEQVFIGIAIYNNSRTICIVFMQITFRQKVPHRIFTQRRVLINSTLLIIETFNTEQSSHMKNCCCSIVPPQWAICSIDPKSSNSNLDYTSF